jgi:anti-sigma factor RsiW
MTDQEFLELLNLYVDREISAADAQRLEAAVLASPRRKSIYQQYCKMQKACSMLSNEYSESGEAQAPAVFTSPTGWRMGPWVAGLAAACVILVVGTKFRGALATSHAPQAGAEQAVAAPVLASSEHMQPVYFAHAQAPQPVRGIASVFTNSDVAPQAEQLNWIGNIHLTPVVFTASPDFRLSPRVDLKASAVEDPLGTRSPEEPAEMTAFRFQR